MESNHWIFDRTVKNSDAVKEQLPSMISVRRRINWTRISKWFMCGQWNMEMGLVWTRHHLKTKICPTNSSVKHKTITFEIWGFVPPGQDLPSDQRIKQISSKTSLWTFPPRKGDAYSASIMEQIWYCHACKTGSRLAYNRLGWMVTPPGETSLP